MDEEMMQENRSRELDESELAAVSGGMDIFEDAVEAVTEVVQEVTGGGEEATEGRTPLADVTQEFADNSENEGRGVVEATGNPNIEGAQPEDIPPEENAENIPPEQQ